ncbi:alpha/beta fold hydrolase [Candidatus Tisiphia endosymbiont of Nemotelus uliginosus]|uniref:alpha/beta fold hydrolase n=1 Tax=Candidatus Tisiphia endosymbiont of Nemotelus uliginosus TaxID=3077926 RepID=UPI0035C8EE44
MNKDLKQVLASLTKSQQILLYEKFKHVSQVSDHTSDNKDSIAITGVSFRFPGKVDDKNSYWKLLASGINAITKIPALRWSDFDNREYYGGFIENVDCFDASFFNISPREAELMDPQQRLLLQIVCQTIEDAGYAVGSLSGTRTGLYVGALSNDYQRLQKKFNIEHSFTTTGTSFSMIANRISYLLNLKGPSLVIDTACSSSLVALHQAINAIKMQQCDQALVGATNLLLSSDWFMEFSNAGMLSPTGNCKTFDCNADGYVRGEGIAAIMLKPLNKALLDKDHIYGIILGSAVNHGGKANSLTAPNPISQKELLIEAYKVSQIPASTISYVEAHGTGTPLGDPIEVEALKLAFSELLIEEQGLQNSKHYCGLGSVKTNIGHLEATAGLAGLIKILLSFENKQLPGLVNFTELNPKINLTDSPFYIVKGLQEWKNLLDVNHLPIPRRAGVSSFGFGGTNAHIVLEEVPTQNISQQLSKSSYLITLSAKTQESLQQKLVDLKIWITTMINHGECNTNRTLENISYTLNIGRDHFKVRCMMVVSSIQELEATLKLVNQEQRPSNYLIGNATLQLRELTDDKLLAKIIDEIRDDQSCNIAHYRNNLILLGDLYVQGYAIDWHILHQRETKQRISLPTYPFLKERYWISQQDVKLSTTSDIKFSSNIQIITKIISEFLQIDVVKLQEEESLDNFGVDSIALLSILEQCNQVFGMSIMLDQIAGIKTIKLLANAYKNQKGMDDTIVVTENESLISASIKLTNNLKKDEIFLKYQKVFLNYHELQISLLPIFKSTNIEIFRAGAGEPIVFLPPLDSIASIWRMQFIEFVKDYEVISLHYPGYGISDFTYNIANLESISDIIIEMLDNLNISTPVHLVGWSLGGLIAQKIAIKYRERIKTLTLVNTTSKLMYNADVESITLILKLLEKDFNQYNSSNNQKLSPITMEDIKGANNLDITFHYFNEVFKHDYRDKIRSINTPTLIIAGEQDMLTTVKDAEYMHNKTF